MALQAKLGFWLFGAVQIGQRRIETGVGRKPYALRPMAGMAVDAGHRPRLVRASFPEQPVALLMTGKAHFILFSGGVWRIFREANRDGFLSATRLEVSSAWAVACFTSKFLLVVSGMRERFAHRCVLKVLALIRMARDADLAANVIRSGS